MILLILNFLILRAWTLPTSDESLKLDSSTRISQHTDFRHTGFEFNESKVIVWEKCGVSARTKISPIFKSTLDDRSKLSLFYNPILNSLVFEKENPDGQYNTSVVKVPEENLNTLFFSFRDPNKVHITVDCPGTSRHKFSWESENLGRMTHVELFTNAEGFDSIEKALSTFQCRSLLSIRPGSIVQFNNGQQQKPSPIQTIDTRDPSIIYSFNNDGVTYSFNYLNGMFQIISSNGSEILINTSRPVPPNGFYLVFSNNGLHIYDRCPYHNNQIGFWPTDMFKNKFNIETSRVYSMGNGASDQLLESYCSINSILNINKTVSELTCLPADQIQNELKIIGKTMGFSNLFLPNNEQMIRLNVVKSFEANSFSYLVSSVHRILFASRRNAPTRFFNRPMSDYVEGFSDGQKNFWLGLDTLSKITNEQDFGMRIEMKVGDIMYSEEYSLFRVMGGVDKYRLIIGGLKTPGFGNLWEHNETEFSTFDHGPNTVVAKRLLGGFWHTFDDASSDVYYCFSCETGDDDKGSFYDQPDLRFKEIRETNMFLIL